MSFEAGLAIAMSLIFTTFIADWPRAVIGLFVGLAGAYVPYATLFVPTFAIAIAALVEFVYPILDHTSEPTFQSFAIGALCALVSASSVYVMLRNLRNRF